MIEPVLLTIPGRPVGKQRAGRNGRHSYTLPETKAFQDAVGMLARPHFPQPMEGPVRLTIIATFKPPESWTKARRAAAIGQAHTSTPDGDNVAKAVQDGLNRVAWRDDRQVSRLDVRKYWGHVECTVVTIEPDVLFSEHFTLAGSPPYDGGDETDEFST